MIIKTTIEVEKLPVLRQFESGPLNNREYDRPVVHVRECKPLAIRLKGNEPNDVDIGTFAVEVEVDQSYHIHNEQVPLKVVNALFDCLGGICTETTVKLFNLSPRQTIALYSFLLSDRNKMLLTDTARYQQEAVSIRACKTGDCSGNSVVPDHTVTLSFAGVWQDGNGLDNPKNSALLTQIFEALGIFPDS